MHMKWGLRGDVAVAMTLLACACQPAAAASPLMTVSAAAAEAPKVATSDPFIMPPLPASEIDVDVPRALAVIAEFAPPVPPKPAKVSRIAPFARALRRMLFRCTNTALKRDPNLEGDFVLRIVGNGWGQTVTVEGIDADSPLWGLRRCIESALGRHELPDIPVDSFDISYPIALRSH